MSNNLQVKTISKAKNARNKGMVFIGLCVVACKLPLMLALIGFGGIGATASLFNFSPAVQFTGLVIGGFGIATVISYWMYRRLNS